jgi:hypothetical protein
VANVELRAAPAAQSELLHAQNRDAAAEVAERVRGVLPLPLSAVPTKLRRDAGDVVVRLGYDAQ